MNPNASNSPAIAPEQVPRNTMTAEMKNAMNDPGYVVQMAVGPAYPKLIPQSPEDGIRKDGLYNTKVTRFVLKAARFALDDLRIFDTDGNLVLNSHHPGKNPFDSLDPLGVANTVRDVVAITYTPY